jgi:outer membrane protein assembly factor BamB
MLNFGTDLVVMGGHCNGSDSSAFYQLSAENGKLKWEKMKPELKIARSDFVAMTIPTDHLVDITQQ